MPPRARSLRFLVSRRWLVLLLTVLLFGYACLLLGRWQWHRLESKKASNQIIRTNQKGAPRPVDQVLRHGVDPPSSEQYAVVSATGRYDASKTVIVRYQTHDGNAGADVVVPLVTSSGTALLVDRGWFATSNSGATDASQVPAPPSGQVTVTGWVRQDAGGSAADVVDASTRAISSSRIETAIGIPVYGGFVQVLTESPKPATPLAKPDPPDLSNGPHFFYALQWWFFGILGLFGYGYLAWEEVTGRAELRRTQQPTRRRPSEGPEDAPVDGEHGAADVGRGGTQQERSGTAEL
ncbi:MAG TPA: SURF1 family protein [Nocardioides sp.]|uniref:SURF1 family cytochrome oxidase biogenesis protein n=1 Tax=Nocardioides sp. TaxID=35761 RepID=UPI002F3EE613